MHSYKGKCKHMRSLFEVNSMQLKQKIVAEIGVHMYNANKQTIDVLTKSEQIRPLSS